MNSNINQRKKLKFWHKKRFKILLVFLIIFLIAGWLFYSWYFQVLPQAAINILDDIQVPTVGEKVLVFSPHPDDETIGVGGYITSSTKNGSSIWIVLVTDGNKHHLESERYEEFKKTTSLLGVPEQNLFFLGYPDGHLKEQDLNKVKSQFEDIVSEIQPQIIFAPHPQDHHPDHATTGELIQSIATDKKIILYQYLVHHAHFPRPKKLASDLYLLPPIRMISFDKSWKRFMLPQDIEDTKHKAVLEYHTQLRVPVLKKLLLGLIRKNELFAIPNY